LVLIAAPPFNAASAAHTFKPDPSGGLVFQAQLSQGEVQRLAAAFANTARLPAARVSQLEALIAATDPRVRSQLGAALGSGEFADEVQLLRDSRIPTLLLQGTADGFIDWQYCAQPSNFPGCRLHTELLQECGHNPHFEAPARCNELLAQFLARHAG
jgi:pimeloyl-ACP methyl ester carboxylesterase